jgi:hypothetical protein
LIILSICYGNENLTNTRVKTGQSKRLMGTLRETMKHGAGMAGRQNSETTKLKRRKE